MPNNSSRPIDGTVSGATTPGQSGPRSNGNKGVLCIPQIFKAEVSLSDGLMLYKDTPCGTVVYSPSRQRSLLLMTQEMRIQTMIS